MESGRKFPAKMFIDATYEGDLMAAAGVAFHVGREANSVYGETLNGAEPKLNDKNHRFVKASRSVREAGRFEFGIAAGYSIEERAGCGQWRQTGAGLLLSAVHNGRGRKSSRTGRSRPITTRRGTNCCCATSRRAMSERRGIRCGCRIARPIRTTTVRFRPITSAGTMNIPKPTMRRATNRRGPSFVSARLVVDAGEQPARAGESAG